MLIKLSPLCLPRGIMKEALSSDHPTWIKRSIERNELFQGDTGPVALRVKERLLAKYAISAQAISEDSVLLFRSVGPHTDQWNDVPSVANRRRRVKPAFLHVFIGGCGELTVGDKTISFKRGDVVLMDPSVEHHVKTRSKMCGAISYTVPLTHAKQAVK